MKKNCFIIAVILLCGIAPSLPAKASSVLLEKGIYAENTLGDLDQAITIYKKIIASPQQDRLGVAQALYRLGESYLKKGESSKAKAVLDELVSKYTEQSSIALNARVLLAKTEISQPTLVSQEKSAAIDIVGMPELLSPSWSEGEVLTSTLPSRPGSRFTSTINSATIDGKKYWCIESLLVSHSGEKYYNRIFIEEDSLMPVISFRKEGLRIVSVEYKKDTIEVKKQWQGKPKMIQTFPRKDTVFGFEHVELLLRVLPLAEGFKTTFPVFYNNHNSLFSDIKISVVGKEKVSVPAGNFDAYKVIVDRIITNTYSQKSTYWVSENRRIIKIESLFGLNGHMTMAYSNPVSITSFEDRALKTNF